jgi:endonuclease YncB( thermonuclease family)
MDDLIGFLKKNMINLLIAGVAVLLVVVFVVDMYFVLTPSVRQNLISNVFPTPTLNLQQLVTRAALTAQANATPTPEPTITTMYFTPQAAEVPPTAELQLPTQVPPTLQQPTQSPTQPSPTAAVSTPAAQATSAAPVSGSGTMACIPANPPQTGKVLDIVDGNTLKVMIDDLVYTVRYIGVAVPEAQIYSKAATYENGKLVFLKDVTLIPDASNKDASGRLLRYVMVGGIFANEKMIAKGFGSAVDMTPNSACAQTFSAAEQAARASQLGQWSPTGAVPTP